MILSRSSLRQQYRNGLFRLGLRELRKKHYESPSVEMIELNQQQSLLDSNPDVPGGMKAPDNYELDMCSSAFCLLRQMLWTLWYSDTPMYLHTLSTYYCWDVFVWWIPLLPHRDIVLSFCIESYLTRINFHFLP